MKWLVCGGRDFGDLSIKRTDPRWQERVNQYYFMIRTLNGLSDRYSKFYDPDDNWLPSDIEIISGAARGADSVAIDWAITNWCRFKGYPADWAKHGKAAGPIRNQQMLTEGKPDLVIAFPGGKGTAHMVKIAKAAGIEVLEIPYDQSREETDQGST